MIRITMEYVPSDADAKHRTSVCREVEIKRTRALTSESKAADYSIASAISDMLHFLEKHCELENTILSNHITSNLILMTMPASRPDTEEECEIVWNQMRSLAKKELL